jgi:hypothetical protein
MVSSWFSRSLVASLSPLDPGREKLKEPGRGVLAGVGQDRRNDIGVAEGQGVHSGVKEGRSLDRVIDAYGWPGYKYSSVLKERTNMAGTTPVELFVIRTMG